MKKPILTCLIFALFGSVILTISSCKKEHINVLPVLTTTSVTELSITSAKSGGEVTSNGGETLTERGVCWGTATAPTPLDNKLVSPGDIGSFTITLTGLTKNTKYFLRAYATNSVGTAYGTEISVTTYGLEDVDGNGYHSVVIGAQEWMQENLKTTKYRDGSPIGNVSVANDWANLSTGAYAIYNNDPANLVTYGMLYNWYAVVDAHELCPTGWHAPSDVEWDALAASLGGESVAGGKMKSTGNITDGTGLWYSPNTRATNSSGFTGLPAGLLGDTNGGLPFVFGGVQSYGAWWSTDGDSDFASFRQLQDTHSSLDHYTNYSRNGKSVRCVKD